MDKNEIIIREPKISDLKQALIYVNALSKEKTYVIFQGGLIDKKTERNWLKNSIKKIQEKRAVFLFAFCSAELIGISGIELSFGAREHVGGFGISIGKKYRGMGIGKMLMDSVLEKSKKMKKLKMITLDVFAENTPAISLYKKRGFIICGEIPRSLKRKGKYVDEISMYKEV